MINAFFSAKLINYNTIKIVLFSSVGKADNVPINLYDNHGFLEKLLISNQSFLNGLVVYECKTKNKIELGNDYYIAIESFGMIPSISSGATRLIPLSRMKFIAAIGVRFVNWKGLSIETKPS